MNIFRKNIQPTVEFKNDKSFIPIHYSQSFYSNFAKLLRISEILNIYILPKTHRNFTMKNLQRYDSLINSVEVHLHYLVNVTYYNN